MLDACEGFDDDSLLRNMFRAFDAESNGFVSEADFVKALAAVAPSVDAGLVKLVFAEADAARCGRLSFAAFERVMHRPWSIA